MFDNYYSPAKTVNKQSPFVLQVDIVENFQDQSVECIEYYLKHLNFTSTLFQLERVSNCSYRHKKNRIFQQL